MSEQRLTRNLQATWVYPGGMDVSIDGFTYNHLAQSAIDQLISEGWKLQEKQNPEWVDA